jgi:hypothetical protein
MMLEKYDCDFEVGEKDNEWVKEEGQWQKGSLVYTHELCMPRVGSQRKTSPTVALLLWSVKGKIDP